MSTLERLR
jgi:hypothetical protein